MGDSQNPFAPIALLVLNVEPGIIGQWSGSAGSIPAGWALCDGSQGTPDLRDKFIIAAGGTFAPGAIGGSEDHTHSFSANSHTHTIGVGTGISAGSQYRNSVEGSVASGITAAGSSMPPYYALCFIMKL